MEKKRIIVDYKNITNKLLSLLLETYPNGYEDSIIKFKNARNEWVSAVPLETEDAKYLVKVSVELDKRVEAFSLMEEEDDPVPPPIIDEAPVNEADEDADPDVVEEDSKPRKRKRSAEDRFMEAGFDPEDDYDEDEGDDFSDDEDSYDQDY
ncbi:MAG: DNA primase [Thermaurantimonas sp.]